MLPHELPHLAVDTIGSNDKISHLFCSITQNHSNRSIFFDDIINTTSLDDFRLVTQLVVKSL